MRTKTDIQIVEIDETHGWDESIRKQVGKIYTVYLYDKSVTTNCCEVTPSYELRPLYYSTEFGEHKFSEEIEDQINSEFHNEEPIYVHCSDVEKLEHYNMKRFVSLNKRFTGRESKSYNEFIEEKLEYFNCNHTF